VFLSSNGVDPELMAALSERISKLEDQLSSQTIIAELKESIANHERQLESLDCRISALKPHLSIDFKELISGSPTPVSTPARVPPVSPSDALTEVEFPLKVAKSVDGIISYLTRKHGENVHDEGIVTITSHSLRNDDLKYAVQILADVTDDAYFSSKNEPGQWVCWDFQEMRVRPTQYTIKGQWLKSWVLEGSLDGENWMEMDRKTDNDDLKEKPWRTSFAVSNPTECRFIRLTQTGNNYTWANIGAPDFLFIYLVEFFGTLAANGLVHQALRFPFPSLFRDIYSIRPDYFVSLQPPRMTIL
jgi:uncharacterized coiled-coil protein SlyX